MNVQIDLFPFRDLSGLDPNLLVMLIDKEDLIAAAGDGPYNTAMLGGFVGGGGQRFDVVPNGGSNEVDPNGFNQEFDDPLGDTFGDDFFPGED